MKINEKQLKNIIKESVKKILKENTNDLPYLSDDDIHKQYEGFKITEFRIKPRYIFGGEYRWDISFEITFPNAEHSDFDESLWENVCVYDEKGEKMAFENWYPDDITKQLIDFVRSEIQKHWPEMEALKRDQLNKEEETERSIREKSGYTRHDVDGYPNLNESKLKNIIKESVKKVLKEGQQRTPIFTLNAVDLTTDDGIDDMQYTSQTYYSEDEAIEAAKEMANKYSDWDSVINISVMAGEYEMPSGDVYGEPDAIYTVSNKDMEQTSAAREKSGYVRHDVDDYHTPINEGGYSKLERDIDGKTLLDGAVIRRLRKMAEQIDYISSMSSDKMQDVCSDILNVFWKHKIY